VIPAIIVLLGSHTVARIITFAVVGIYISFQLVVLAALVARQRGWSPAGQFRLGRSGWIVNAVALAYGVAAIVILSIKTPPAAGTGFFDRWLVPISAGIVAAVGLAYLFAFRPKAVVRPDARVGATDAPEAPAVPAH
jgi:amino acid transporter